MPDRAVLFVDGNNWYHSLHGLGLTRLSRLDYAVISKKLTGPRTWIATRYYIGEVHQRGNSRLYADQRRFLARLTSTDSRISVHLGRLETRVVRNEAALELRRYLGNPPMRIERGIYNDLLEIARRHATSQVAVEKAVDVMLAVDMVTMGERNEFDAAYLLSADGDFTPALEALRALRERVYAVSPSYGAQVAAAVDSFIRLDATWFRDCYR